MTVNGPPCPTVVRFSPRRAPLPPRPPRRRPLRRPAPGRPDRVSRALALSGGGARGAYQAGIIDYLRLSRQIPEGAPLQPYGLIAGTSIGALNGYFVAALSAELRERAVTAIRLTVGPTAVLREATPDLLIDALRASTAIPVAFDPVELPAHKGGGNDLYVDGGVTANTPVGAARVAATRIDVVAAPHTRSRHARRIPRNIWQTRDRRTQFRG